MSKSNTYGQVHDSETLTHLTLAARLCRDPDWIINQFIFPKDPDTGEDLDGVAHVKRGDLYFITGEDWRLYVQSLARPRRRPRRTGGNSHIQKNKKKSAS